jgi:Fe-S cluster assembly protein SufD
MRNGALTLDTSTIAFPALTAEPSHVQQWRREARELLAGQGLPGPQDEHWRRANLPVLRALDAAPTEAMGEDGVIDRSMPPDLTSVLLVDGRFEACANAGTDDDAVSIEPLRSALHALQAKGPAWLPNEALSGDHRFALLNHALGADGTRILVHRERRLQRPILLAHRGALAREGMTAVSHAITLEAGARAVLVELHDERCTAARTLLSEVRVELGAGARLQHLRLVVPTHASHWVDTLTVELARDARYEQRFLLAPARALRSTQAVRMLGDGAEAALHAGAVASRGADVDLRVAVAHEADHVRSEQAVHVLAGHGRATVDSEAAVPRGRRAIRSLQSLRALQLDGTCDVALRPRLAILSDDVDCRHGATTSAFSDEQLFFLRSRGFDRAVALRLLARAHLQQQFPALGVPALDRLVQEQLEVALAAAIPGMEGTNESA